MRHPRPICAAVALGCVLAASACSARAPRAETTEGRLTVGVSTTGPGVESLRFKVVVEPAGLESAIDADAGVYTTASAPPGEHVVRLTGLPAQCQVQGASERRVRVGPRQSPVIRFVVTCG